MVAINDGVLIRNQIHRILKTHFKQKPYYADLLDLFNEVYHGFWIMSLYLTTESNPPHLTLTDRISDFLWADD